MSGTPSRPFGRSSSVPTQVLLVPARRLPGLLVVLLLALPAAAGAEHGPALLAVSPDGARVESAHGTAELPRRPGLELSAIADLAAGWVAAGTERHGESVRMALFTGGADAAAAVRELPAPAASAPLLLGPRPVISNGALHGIAWLEGAAGDRLAVRFAPWNGAGWAAAETVAPPGPGSQLAVSAARLDDGSTLLAWSRFDGEDDEIFWSLYRDGAWSAPRRLAADDAVPDVTPAVTAVPGGALAAWSAFDGEGYRILVSRFDGAGWSTPRAVGARHTAFPTFEPDPSGPAGALQLLYRSGSPRGWTLTELGADARPLRSAHVAAPAGNRERPRLAGVEGAGPVLRWSGGERRALRWREAGR
jgi:hypothetical protein